MGRRQVMQTTTLLYRRLILKYLNLQVEKLSLTAKRINSSVRTDVHRQYIKRLEFLPNLAFVNSNLT